MTTTADEAAFLQAIAANPEDDTVRLVYADWLDEHGNPDRAEFIRVQCELARNPQTSEVCPHCGWEDGYNHKSGCLYSREYELLERYRDKWAKCPCPECGGTGKINLDAVFRKPSWTQCPTCRGTSDLLMQNIGIDDDPRDIQFARGFIDSVECRLDEVVRLPPPDAYVYPNLAVPTPWARAVVTTLPVTRFRLEGYEPFKGHHPTWGWYVGESPTWALPRLLFDSLPDEGRSQRNAPRWKDYLTREAALDAVAVAAARVVRRAVYGS